MKPKTKTFLNLAVLVLAAVLAVIAYTAPRLSDNAAGAAAMVNREYADRTGTEVAAYDITELTALGVVTEVNHTPGKYLPPESDFGEPVAIGDLKPADFGTIRIVFLNVEPMSGDFDGLVEKLGIFSTIPAKSVDVSVRLNFLCSAATVYNNGVYVDRVGKMADYDVGNYTAQLSDPFFDPTAYVGVKPVTVNLRFLLDRKYIEPERLSAARVVTIHYQCREKNAEGVIGNPLVGTVSAVSAAAESQKNSLLAVLCAAALLLFSFAMLMLVKRNFSSVGQWLSLLSVFLFFLSLYLPYGTVFAALMPPALKAAAVSMLLASALLSCKPSKKLKLPYLITLGLCAINVVLSVMFRITGALASFPIYAIVTSSVFSGAVLLFGASDFTENKNGTRLAVPLIDCFVSVCAFLSTDPLHSMSPVAWTCVPILIGAFLLIGGEFLLTERKNRYLTDNLKAEVDAQTASLKTAVEDKNRLLSFISHDLRKPTVAVADSLANLDTAALGDNGKKSVREMLAKMTTMKESFYEISTYAKDNPAGESFAVFDFVPFCENLLENLRPDCTAAGIDMICKLPKKLTVYAKSRALTSALENIVLNATEHAACSEIAVSASKKNGFVKLTVADNGKGLNSALDVFSPYVGTSKDDNNLGLGLFIAKSHIESMGGSISYETSPRGTTFTLTLLSDVG